MGEKYDELLAQADAGDQEAAVRLAALERQAERDTNRSMAAVYAGDLNREAVLNQHREDLASRPGLLNQVTRIYERENGIGQFPKSASRG